ncbi:hypothetical protein [Bradyrhizobium sp. DASA03007]|uniref:hypothetical protein n=1 Tax=unclassified Bradyrhizobium TaxID=2631580 RepID=UPI003F6E916A
MQPNESIDGRRSLAPSGPELGGCSTIDGIAAASRSMATAGPRSAIATCCPKVEHCEVAGDRSRGGRRLNVRDTPDRRVLCDALIEATEA